MMNNEMPIKPLWLKEGRVLLEVMSYKIKTEAGIDVPEPTDVSVRVGRVMEASTNLNLDLQPGDYVLFNGFVGAAIKLNFLKKDVHVLIHAMDIMAIWTVDPKHFFDKSGKKPEQQIVN